MMSILSSDQTESGRLGLDLVCSAFGCDRAFFKGLCRRKTSGTWTLRVREQVSNRKTWHDTHIARNLWQVLFRKQVSREEGMRQQDSLQNKLNEMNNQEMNTKRTSSQSDKQMEVENLVIIDITQDCVCLDSEERNDSNLIQS